MKLVFFEAWNAIFLISADNKILKQFGKYVYDGGVGEDFAATLFMISEENRKKIVLGKNVILLRLWREDDRK